MFRVPAGQLDVFFEEVSTHILCPFFYQIVFSLVGYRGSLYILDIIRYQIYDL